MKGTVVALEHFNMTLLSVHIEKCIYLTVKVILKCTDVRCTVELSMKTSQPWVVWGDKTTQKASSNYLLPSIITYNSSLYFTANVASYLQPNITDVHSQRSLRYMQE